MSKTKVKSYKNEVVAVNNDELKKIAVSVGRRVDLMCICKFATPPR